ncbi:microtubule-associated Nat9 isoform X2 [Rhodnius prolixus]|uniref:microtubule-associated Nat9 isoform X2 n=1 Tax=Rhodnius prolixus TaxID=13249 RepID=UPI003D18A92F
MKQNSSTKIIMSKVVLVPYRISHVEKWMNSDELRKQTASEKLTLSEEYEMQQTWLNDENKCTFIILDKETYETSANETESMIGDANLYLTKTEGGFIGEIGLMIAECSFRGRGYGKEALFGLLNYGIKNLNINKFNAIISMDNSVSIGMFFKLQFSKVSESCVFNEITLTREVSDDFLKFLEHSIVTYIEDSTEENK